LSYLNYKRLYCQGKRGLVGLIDTIHAGFANVGKTEGKVPMPQIPLVRESGGTIGKKGKG
jgi:hypothetical protein